MVGRQIDDIDILAYEPTVDAIPLRSSRPSGKHWQQSDATGRLARRSGIVNELFRCVHTLKGNSGLFTFPEMTTCFMPAKTAGMVRSGDVVYSRELADSLLEAMDFVACCAAILSPLDTLMLSGQELPSPG